MFAAARPRNIDLRPHREDGYRTACRTQRGIYQVERFFALLTDQHLRRNSPRLSARGEKPNIRISLEGCRKDSKSLLVSRLDTPRLAAACYHLCILAQNNGMKYASVALRMYLGMSRLNQDVRPINLRRMEPSPY
jgi:hypothetical protein